ncbi:hypothetical protein TWF730_007665 [Orbilia blumenaviensis]|uniref:Uncharacterized protein n=1 Tax=Orbilia blumenaviensis TaxID=1796055 RepID=A0AAV9V9M4_9PEZI
MASLKDRAKKAKTVFSLDTPSPTFLSPSWPDIPGQTSAAILKSLLKLLADLQELPPSTSISTSPEEAAGGTTRRDGGYTLLAGPNPVTAYLEHLVQLAIPSSLPTTNNPNRHKPPPRTPLATFITRSDQPSILHSHIPFLCATASVPLIPLPKGSEQRLVKLLNPENGCVYMLLLFTDTPGIEELKGLLTISDNKNNNNNENNAGDEKLDSAGEGTGEQQQRQVVQLLGKVELPQILHPAEAKWLDTRNKATPTFVGERRKDKRKPQDADTKIPSKGQGGGNKKPPAKKPKKEHG